MIRSYTSLHSISIRSYASSKVINYCAKSIVQSSVPYMASRNHWYLFILSSSFSSSCAEDRTQGLKYIFFTTMPFPLTFTCHTLMRFAYHFAYFYPQSYIMLMHWSSTFLSEHFIFLFMRSHLLHGFNVMTSKYLLLAQLLLQCPPDHWIWV